MEWLFDKQGGLTSVLIFVCDNPTYAPVMDIGWIGNFLGGGAG